MNLVKTKTVDVVPSEDILVQDPSAVVAPDLGVIVDPCHADQYDPLRLVRDAQPTRQRYLGANRVWGPAKRALPIIPVEVQQDKIVGRATHPDWYQGYCGM